MAGIHSARAGLLASPSERQCTHAPYACTVDANAQVLAFLDAFADEFDLRRHIRFCTRVLRVEALGPAGDWGAGPWAVTAASVASDRLVSGSYLAARCTLWAHLVPACACSQLASSHPKPALSSSSYFLNAK